MKIRAFVILALAFASVQPGVVCAQQAQSATLQNQTPPPATTVPPPPPAESLPRPDFRFKGQVGRTLSGFRSAYLSSGCAPAKGRTKRPVDFAR